MKSQIAQLSLLVEGKYVYHATTEEKGREVEKNGYLRAMKSIWGSQPSKPGQVYVTFDKRTAKQFLPEILHRTKAKRGAIVVAKPNWKSVVPDEDAVFGYLQKAKKIDQTWKYFARVVEVEPKEAFDFFRSEYAPSDSQLAYDMQDLVDYLPDKLKKKIIQKSTTVAFSKPLKVVKVEF